MTNEKLNIAVVYSHHKLGDLIWQLPYIKSISDHYNSKVTLIVRPKTQAKDILKDEGYIDDFFYCKFRKKLWYFIEVFILYLFFRKKKFTHVFILDKISRPAIAAKLARVNNIIGPGIKSQKKWLTTKLFLTENDYKNLNYSEQSEKILKFQKISVKEKIPKINIKKQTLSTIKPNINEEKKYVSLGVDSFELYKMWFEEQFAELANKFHENRIAEKFFLIASPDNSNIVKKIIDLSGRDIFYDCSKLNLLQVIKVIKNSIFFVGNNSGPLNLASALQVNAYGLIGNAKVSELTNSNIKPILPPSYENVFKKDRLEMKKINTQQVYNFITSDLF